MIFTRTTAINLIYNILKRIKVIQGGTSAGKTIAILAILINKATKAPKKSPISISVVSRHLPHLKKGAIKDFQDIMKGTGRWNPDHWHDTDKKYTFSNGSYIEFFGADNPDKVMGPRRDILYMNECNKMTFLTYHHLKIRTSGDIYLDFNPTSNFWAHKEVLTGNDAEHLILTYMDNEARPQNVDEDMRDAKHKHDIKKSPYWINYWRVFGLGLIGQLQGAIWTDWSIIVEIPSDAILQGFGGDFGFTNSPTAVLAAYEWKGKRIYDQWIYDTKLTNKDIAQMMILEGYKNDVSYFDSAEPKSIEELRRNGINAHPCANKQDIRPYAIDKIGSEHFYVTERSIETIEDINNYVYQETKDGEILNKPMKVHDHSPDAMIYFEGTEGKYDGSY